MYGPRKTKRRRDGLPAFLDPAQLFKPEEKLDPNGNGLLKNEENLGMISMHPPNCGLWVSIQHLNEIFDVTDWF